MRLVGIDLGGSSVKAGAISESGKILERGSVDVRPEQGADDLLDRMADLARKLGAEGGLGLGAPGLFDRVQGVVLESPNLAYLQGIAIRGELARRLGIDERTVLLENDANAAAIGEHWIGAGRGQEHLLVVTLGTGVGGGFVLDGELYAGPGGMAGEIGHVVVDPAGPPCGCGSRGCLEVLASATGAQRRALELGLPPEEPGNLVLLAERARQGASPERELLRQIGLDLGRGLAAVVTLLDLRLFVVGGGFGAALDVLLPGLREGMSERSYGKRLEGVRVLPAALGADAGWIGAAKLSLSCRTR